MARIPVLSARRNLDAGSPVSYPSGSPVGEALQGLGQSVQRAGAFVQRQNEIADNEFEAIAAEAQRQRDAVDAFDANQGFSRLKLATAERLPEIQSAVPASGLGLHDGAVAAFDENSQKFLAGVPDGLIKEKMQALVETERMAFSGRLAMAERDQRNGWYRSGLEKSVATGQEQVFNDPASLDAARDEALRTIDASGLPEAEKEEWRAKARQGLAISLAEREKRDASAAPVVPSDAAARLGVAGAVPIKGPVGDIIADAALKYGQDPLALATIARLESGGNPNAKNPRSTAGGLFQFIDSTASLYKLLNKFDAVEASDAGARLLRDNRKGLRSSLGREPSIGELYLAHQQGLGGARKLLGNPGAKAVDIVGADAVRLNGGNSGMSARQFANLWVKKAEKVAGKSQASASKTDDDMDSRYADLPFDKRLEIYDGLIAASNNGIKTAQVQAKASYDAYKDRFELNILTGAVDSDQTILNDPSLMDGDKSSLLRTWRAQQTEASQTDMAIQDYLAGSNPNWNPLDSADTATANKVFDRLSELVSTPEQRQTVVDDFVRRTGVIPNSIAADLRRGAFSEDPAALSQAMGEAARIEKLAPESFQTMSSGGDLRKDLASFQHLVNNRGLSAEDAARRLIERRSPEYRVNEEVLGSLADKAVKDLEVGDITDAFDEGIFSLEPGAGVDPSTSNALLAEYREAFREEFIRVGGDEGEAKARAAKELARTWGVSTVSGDKQMMKYPPEKFYPAIDGGYGYIVDDLAETARGFVGGDIGRAMLRPDQGTAADIRAGRPPRYRLFYERAVDGQMIVDQVPGYWAMPADRVRDLASEARVNDGAMRRAEALRATYDAANESGMAPEAVDSVLPVVRGIAKTLPRLQRVNPLSPKGKTSGDTREQSMDNFLAPPEIPGSRAALEETLKEKREELIRNAPR